MPRKRRSRRKQATSEGPTICLYVQHFLKDLNSSMYTIRLPHNLSELDDEDEDEMIDLSDCASKQNISLSTFPETNRFMHHTAFVNIGSKIYLFGGKTWYVEENTPASEIETLSRRVQVIDINDPAQEIKSVTPMHTPKNSPCVFVANGMIYVIGTDSLDYTTKLPGYSYTGLFERFDPSNDSWKVLADPPFFPSRKGAKLLDCATVIGTRVIIGCPSFHAVFHLEKLTWDDTLPQLQAPLFPFGSIFVQDSLYHLSGSDVPSLTKPPFVNSPFKRDTAVTKFPFPAPIKMMDNRSLVLGALTEQTMAEATDLNDNISFTKRGYSTRRFFFHLGGRFFCHVVTAQLSDPICRTQREPRSRGVFIKFFEEVPAGIHNYNNSTNNNNNFDNNNSKTKFRTVASFCYKIKTNFTNVSLCTRCTVIGTVPDSWINSPPKKKQESKLKSVNKEMNSMTRDLSRVMRSELEKPSPENGDRETEELKKLLAAREAEISLLKAEVSLLKAQVSKGKEKL